MPDFWVTIGNTIWYVLLAFFFISYLMAMFNVITDLFRDPELPGFAKATWILALVLIPLVTVLVYLLLRGQGMAERASERIAESKRRTDEYIREVATHSPSEEIARARALLDSGTITQQEYAALKSRALAPR
ncbi:MAG: SHOCT domain-containing protein [Actinomycetota bacterium]